jgi:uncharacterized protein YndB with AHSA1/START domain
MPLGHGTFTLQRTWTASPGQVFSVWSEPTLRAQWLGGPPGRWTVLQHSLGFRTGGTEILEGRVDDSGVLTYQEARFHLVDPARRLIYVHDLHRAGSFHSITLASVLIEADAGRTHLAYTEQITFLDGTDGTADRQRSAEQQLAALENALRLERA